MTYPITPPPELVQQWMRVNSAEYEQHIATRAAQWGADQELEACQQWLIEEDQPGFACQLRAARRPKPPSLKEQALKALGPEPLPETGPTGDAILNTGSIERHRAIRRALEALND